MNQINKKDGFYPSENLRSRLIELGVPRAKHDIVQLGEVLPKGCFTTKTESDEFPWRCEYKGGYGVTASGANTEADARAKMLVYLLENGLIK